MAYRHPKMERGTLGLAQPVALRLAALGYTRVHWYRGGKEVWEAGSLPETDADKAEW